VTASGDFLTKTITAKSKINPKTTPVPSCTQQLNTPFDLIPCPSNKPVGTNGCNEVNNLYAGKYPTSCCKKGSEPVIVTSSINRNKKSFLCEAKGLRKL